MRIAIKTPSVQPALQTAAAIYVHELVHHWLLQHQENVTCFTDGTQRAAPVAGVHTIAIDPAITNGLKARFWYDVKLPPVLKKEKAGLFIGTENYISLTARTPQLLLAPQLAFLQQPAAFAGAEKTAFFRKMLRKAAHIVVPSVFAQTQLVQQGLPAQKISVIAAAAGPSFTPASWAQREQTKVAYAGACEYFLCYGTMYTYRNIGLLLRAFSVFKKWQKSNMKLLLVGDVPARYAEELDKMDSYKFRDDVELLPTQLPQVMAQLVAAAYAVVLPSSYEDMGLQALEALACEVPVLATHTGAVPELCGEAALYATPGNVDELGQFMIQLYKDEALRNTLIEKGKQRSALFGWHQAAAQLEAIVTQYR